MLDAKLVDSEEYNDSYFNQNHEGNSLKVNGYSVNENEFSSIIHTKESRS